MALRILYLATTNNNKALQQDDKSNDLAADSESTLMGAQSLGSQRSKLIEETDTETTTQNHDVLQCLEPPNNLSCALCITALCIWC